VLLYSTSQEITLHLMARRFIIVLTKAHCRSPCWRQKNSRRKTSQLRYKPVGIFIYIFFCLYFDLSSLLVAVFSPLIGHSPRGTSVRFTEQDSSCSLSELAVSRCSAPGLNSRGTESECRLLRGLKGFPNALQANSDVLSPLGHACFLLRPFQFIIH